MRKYLITSLVTLIALILIIPSCRSTNNESKEIREIVDSFAICYFNWQYEKATKYCTQSSKKWLEFAASQVNNQDIEILRNQQDEPTIKLISIDYNELEQIATVQISANNFVESHGFGECPTKRENAIFNLKIVKEENKWKIKMEALPQSERQNPD